MLTNGDILNFDLCDLQKYVKSKTHVLWVPFYVMYMYTVIYSTLFFFKMATWLPYLKSDRAVIW
jgi:hypothetical protein